MLGEEEAKELAEQVNVISELVLGYREGTFPQIIQEIAKLKVKAGKHKANENVELLFSLIDDLSEIKDSIIEAT